ncbi:hypothetical protein [Methylobacterium sp. A54F]
MAEGTDDLAGARAEIAALIAAELGYGDLDALGPEDRGRVEAETERLLASQGAVVPDRSDPLAAHVRLQRLIAAYRDRAALKGDEDDARLAAEGEVFAREDDA